MRMGRPPTIGAVLAGAAICSRMKKACRVGRRRFQMHWKQLEAAFRVKHLVSSVHSKRNAIARRSVDSKDRSERPEIRSSRLATGSTAEPLKQAELKAVRNEIKPDPMSTMRAPQVPSMLPFNNLAFGATFGGPASLKPMTMAPMPMAMPMSPAPLTKKPTPAAATPLCGKSDTDNLKMAKQVLNEDISKLQSQVNKLKQKCDAQEEQLQKAERRAEHSASTAAEESSRRNGVLEFIRFLDNELKSIADRVPSDAADGLKALQNHSERFLTEQGVRPLEATARGGLRSSRPRNGGGRTRRECSGNTTTRPTNQPHQTSPLDTSRRRQSFLHVAWGIAPAAVCRGPVAM